MVSKLRQKENQVQLNSEGEDETSPLSLMALKSFGGLGVIIMFYE